MTTGTERLRAMLLHPSMRDWEAVYWEDTPIISHLSSPVLERIWNEDFEDELDDWKSIRDTERGLEGFWRE